MKMTLETLVKNLIKLGLTYDIKVPVSYSVFKNRATVVRYQAKGKVGKVVFIGLPNKNLFGFYIKLDTDSQAMKEAYALYTKLVGGDMTDFDNRIIQWGNTGIPDTYRRLKTSK